MENQLEKQRKKLDNLIDMRLADEIAREDYQRKRGEIEDDIAKTQENIEKCKRLESDTTDSVADKICALKIAIEKEFDFDTYNIPESIIDAFVEYIKVEKDRYIWKISLVDGEFTCLASGRQNTGCFLSRFSLQCAMQHRQRLLINKKCKDARIERYSCEKIPYPVSAGYGIFNKIYKRL